MKPSLPLLMLPVALGVGYFAGKHGQASPDEVAGSAGGSARETRVATRGQRPDPFGADMVSLSSLEDLRKVFKQQSYTVASARLTLAANELKADEIPALMEMAQEEARKNPNRYDMVNSALTVALFQRWALVDPEASVAFVMNCKSRSFRQFAAGSCFGALAKADPDRAMMAFEKLPKGEIREQASTAMLASLADSDPSAACDLLEKESSPGGIGDYYAAQLFGKWAETDPAAAAARMATLPPDRVDERAAGMLAASWAMKDPDAALAWAKTLSGDRKAASAMEIYKVMAREDPEKAWARLLTEPGYLRGRAVGGILEVVADEDPGKAMAMLMKMENKSDLRIATNSFLGNLNWNDTRLAFELIDQVKDPATRRENLSDQMYYAAWTAGDLLKEQIGKLSEREKIDTSGAVLRGLVSSDPSMAEKYFLDLPESQRNTAILSQMMAAYSNRDPDKALDFAVSLPNTQEQTAAVKGLFDNWSREDPEAAAEGWKKLPAGQGRLEALDNVAGSWSQSDPEAARAWADSLSGAEKARALAAVLPALARDHPASASAQLAGLIASPPDGMAQNLASSAGSLARQWASDDPASASAWAAGLPEGPARDAGLRAVAASWSQYDAVATSQWLGTLEAGSSRDAAIQPLVGHIRGSDPPRPFRGRPPSRIKTPVSMSCAKPSSRGAAPTCKRRV
ncbi:MAG: hypothetical protein EOP83_01565 [Verrucomicrobiaceae bacterium]|nr:MAG: hypothetical protein EOP83_01565 [Verrucomicrobiaceae bacterium]